MKPIKTKGRFSTQVSTDIFKSTPPSGITKSPGKKGRIKQHTPMIAMYSVVQILTCLLTLTVQYIFVSFFEYTNLTKLHATTLAGTLVLRLSFGASFGISGFLGLWATHKRSFVSIGVSLIAASLAACFGLIFLVESAMCVTHMVSEIEKNLVEISVTNNPILNIDVELGPKSSFTQLQLQNKDLKLLLAIFTTQLIASFIQEAVIILFCSKMNKMLSRNAQYGYTFVPIPSIANEPIIQHNLTVNTTVQSNVFTKGGNVSK